ncbi:uncharacterized protein LOC128874693 isoform X1 [Hylaeus volcanicus]|uniref:uncharacterized protein LOC128874693 isoform X1 n=1 Tax=Hylaeus volcanicus TaxID=313075 RepID=UPI0023B86110|nr:uncharacterized protein LOC128874693 isoform X1 [Hylaeus volcanicus]
MYALVRSTKILNCDGDVVVNTDHCPKCATSLKFAKKSAGPATVNGKAEAMKMSTKPLEVNYAMQIVSIGVRSDNVYEARMLLAPEVDMSSIKITVKGNNLRVNVCKPLNDKIVNHLPDIAETSVLGDLIKTTMKHCENLLIPDDIDGEKIRAVVDNKQRMLVLTAPAIKPSQTRKKIIVKN